MKPGGCSAVLALLTRAASLLLSHAGRSFHCHTWSSGVYCMLCLGALIATCRRFSAYTGREPNQMFVRAFQTGVCCDMQVRGRAGEAPVEGSTLQQVLCPCWKEAQRDLCVGRVQVRHWAVADDVWLRHHCSSPGKLPKILTQMKGDVVHHRQGICAAP